VYYAFRELDFFFPVRSVFPYVTCLGGGRWHFFAPRYAYGTIPSRYISMGVRDDKNIKRQFTFAQLFVTLCKCSEFSGQRFREGFLYVASTLREVRQTLLPDCALTKWLSVLLRAWQFTIVYSTGHKLCPRSGDGQRLNRISYFENINQAYEITLLSVYPSY
jgi:hypothetical protein